MSSTCISASNISDCIPKAYQPKVVQQILDKYPETILPETITREYIDNLSTEHSVWGSSKKPFYCIIIPYTVIISCGGVLFTNKTMFLPYDDIVRSEIYYMKSSNYYKIGHIACDKNSLWCFKPKYQEHLNEREWYDFTSATTETLLNNINVLHIDPSIKKRYSSKISICGNECQYVDHVQKDVLSKILLLNGAKLLPEDTLKHMLSLTHKHIMCVSTMIGLQKPVSVTYPECQRSYHIAMLIIKLTYMIQIYSMKKVTCPVLLKLTSLISFHPRMLKECIKTECWENIIYLCELAKKDSYPFELSIEVIDPLQELINSNKIKSIPVSAFNAICSISKDPLCRKTAKFVITKLCRFDLLNTINAISIKPTPLRRCWSPESFMSSSSSSSSMVSSTSSTDSSQNAQDAIIL